MSYAAQESAQRRMSAWVAQLVSTHLLASACPAHWVDTQVLTKPNANLVKGAKFRIATAVDASLAKRASIADQHFVKTASKAATHWITVGSDLYRDHLGLI